MEYVRALETAGVTYTDQYWIVKIRKWLDENDPGFIPPGWDLDHITPTLHGGSPHPLNLVAMPLSINRSFRADVTLKKVLYVGCETMMWAALYHGKQHSLKLEVVADMLYAISSRPKQQRKVLRACVCDSLPSKSAIVLGANR